MWKEEHGSRDSKGGKQQQNQGKGAKKPFNKVLKGNGKGGGKKVGNIFRVRNVLQKLISSSDSSKKKNRIYQHLCFTRVFCRQGMAKHHKLQSAFIGGLYGQTPQPSYGNYFGVVTENL